jgi:hypothetical protein
MKINYKIKSDQYEFYATIKEIQHYEYRVTFGADRQCINVSIYNIATDIINNKPIMKNIDLYKILEKIKSGDIVNLEILRPDGIVNFEIKL